MKKLFITLVAIVAFSLSASAQKVFSDNDFRTILGYFTYDKKPYLSIVEKNGYNAAYDDIIDNITIYDMELNFVDKIKLGTATERIDINQVIDKDGFDFEVDSYSYPFLTQTFFNDDADWEYIVPVYETVTGEWGTHEDVVAYTVKKTNGTVIGTFSTGKWSLDVNVINDVVYPYVYVEDGDDYNYAYYTIPEFRKYLFGTADGIQAVPAMTRTVSKQAFDLAGRRVSEHHKGIVIKDGKKIIEK